MKQSCRGCIYSLRYGGDWGCNYLEIMHHARQLICKVRGKDDVCTVRVDGKPITPQVVDNERVPAHKYDMKPRDLEKVRNHQRRGGKPLSFDANKAIALINLGKTDEEAAGELGVNIRTFKAWRNRKGIPGNRKRDWSWKRDRGDESSK